MALETTLSELALFADRDRTQLRRASRLMTMTKVPAGRTLMREGAVGREFVLVVDGDLTVFTDHGAEQVGSGGFVGELALLTGSCRTATVVTTSPADLLVLNRREFAALLDEVPTVGVRIARTAVQRQLRADSNVASSRPAQPQHTSSN